MGRDLRSLRIIAALLIALGIASTALYCEWSASPAASPVACRRSFLWINLALAAAVAVLLLTLRRG